MNRTTMLSALCVAGSVALAAAAGAQDTASQSQQTTTTRDTTQMSQDGTVRATQVTTIEGKVVRYEPGRTIVVVGPDGKEMTYMLSTTTSVPAGVEIGRVVSLNTEPSSNGTATVSRVTVRSMTPDGQIKTETQTHATDASGNQTMTKTTDYTGTVSAFDPGKSVTLVLPDKKTVVYTLDASAIVPSDVAVGKMYTIQTTRMTANGPLVVKKITSTTTTTTKKTTSNQ